MLQHVQRVEHFSNELGKLQEAMEADPKEALDKFLKNYEEGAKELDKSLQASVEEFRTIAQVMDKHNDQVRWWAQWSDPSAEHSVMYRV